MKTVMTGIVLGLEDLRDTMRHVDFNLYLKTDESLAAAH